MHQVPQVVIFNSPERVMADRREGAGENKRKTVVNDLIEVHINGILDSVFEPGAEGVFSGVGDILRIRDIHDLDAEELERIEEHGSDMGEGDGGVVVVVAQKHIPVEALEAEDVGGACAAEGFRAEIEEMAFADVGAELVAVAVDLDNGDC